jgi:hypothetical protein
MATRIPPKQLDHSPEPGLREERRGFAAKAPNSFWKPVEGEKEKPTTNRMTA